MSGRGFNAVWLALSAASALPQTITAEPPSNSRGVAPFSASYQANWKSINVGSSELELKQEDGRPDRYVYTWTTSARGVFRVLYSSDLVYKSWFSVSGTEVRPEKYRGAEGSATVDVDFDWDRRLATGQSEGKPVEIKLQPGTQDLASIQVQVMLDLRSGNLPSIFHIVDKDELKDFIYTREADARIRTALGELDTVVVASSRTGNDRVLRMWFAPSLDYIPVQAERTRAGKLEFSMRIKSLKR
jgi:Protein of unknown function (DUF3108)